MKGGWQTKMLGDVCCTIQDGAHESPQKLFSEPADGRFLYITSKNIRTNYIDLGNVSYVDQDFHNRIYPRCQPRVGDVLLTKDGASTGNVTLNTIDEPFSLLSSVCLIKTDPRVLEPAFLCYYLQSPDGLKSITGQMTGAAIKRIILRNIKLATIPLPPTIEQRRIVGVLDKALKGIASAKTNADKNRHSARAIFRSALDAVFGGPGSGWTETAIGKVVQFIDYRGKTPAKTASGIRLITAKNVKMGYIQETPKEFIASANYQSWMTRGIPEKGDVLFTTEAPLANVAQLDTDEKVAFAQRIIIMRPDAAKLDSTFLKYMLLSGPVQQRIRSQGTGATVQGIKASLLKLIAISFPEKLSEQKQIVDKLDRLSEETQRLELIYQRKLAEIEALRSSLLHHAFTGNL
ncbi:MAG TPA: restriction endonuclease subunit S [Candidatus Sulfotelmatobacter sp.]|nr:restriction endonuclease subunit S [Candidatus Sulfotelmatobacter sp.]